MEHALWETNTSKVATGTSSCYTSSYRQIVSRAFVEMTSNAPRRQWYVSQDVSSSSVQWRQMPQGESVIGITRSLALHLLQWRQMPPGSSDRYRKIVSVHPLQWRQITPGSSHRYRKIVSSASVAMTLMPPESSDRYHKIVSSAFVAITSNATRKQW